LTVVSNEMCQPSGLPAFRKKLSYTAKTKLFSIELPPFMAGPLDKLELTASSQSEVERLFAQAVIDIKKVNVTEKKVIIFTIETTEMRTSSYGSVDPKTIEIACTVANMRTSTIGTKQNRSFVTIPSSLPSVNFDDRYNIKVVDYTYELEAYFAGLLAGMNDLRKSIEFKFVRNPQGVYSLK